MKHIREELNWLHEQDGVTEVKLIPAKPHQKVEVTVRGRTLRNLIPGTPSDGRAMLNWRAQMRRRLAAVQ